METSKFLFHLMTCFALQVLTNLTTGKYICTVSDERTVIITEACYVIIKNLTSFDDAKEICNNTGGYLWEMSDRQSVYEKIKKNSNFTGEYWINRELDIKIDNLAGTQLCHPSVRFGSYKKNKELIMNLHFYSAPHRCWSRLGYICKYDMPEKDGGSKADSKIAVPFIAVCVLASVLLVTFLILLTRKQRNGGVDTSEGGKGRGERENTCGRTDEEVGFSTAQLALTQRKEITTAQIALTEKKEKNTEQKALSQKTEQMDDYIETSDA